jgi:hypothetical protein
MSSDEINSYFNDEKMDFFEYRKKLDEKKSRRTES